MYLQGDLAFSILHSRGRKSLDLLANDTETRDNWVAGLDLLISNNVGKPYTNITEECVFEIGKKFELINRNF